MLLHVKGLLASGVVIAVALKCWIPDQSTILRWELLRFKEGLGYEEKSNSSTLCARYRENEVHFRETLGYGRLSLEDHGGYSRHRRLLNNNLANAPLGQEQEYWMDTTAVLCLLPYWKDVRREAAMKQRTDFLHRCYSTRRSLPRSSSTPSHFWMRRWKLAMQRQWWMGKCHCARSYLAEFKPDENATPQQQLLQTLQEMY